MGIVHYLSSGGKHGDSALLVLRGLGIMHYLSSGGKHGDSALFVLRGGKHGDEANPTPRTCIRVYSNTGRIGPQLLHDAFELLLSALTLHKVVQFPPGIPCGGT